LDRIDLQVEMDAVTIAEIEQCGEAEDSHTVQARVLAAREKQLARYAKERYFCNAQLPQRGVEKYCLLSPEAGTLLRRAAEQFHISMRAYGRIRKVARTLADLGGRETIEVGDVAQAIQLRNLDGQYWR
jgi:magnesium chelatase family protein